VESTYAPADGACLFHTLQPPWWVAGGWAIDLFLGKPTRPHVDLDVAALRTDQLAIQHYLRTRGWDLQMVVEPGVLRPWPDGEVLDASRHAVWCRPRPDAPWAFELLLNDAEGGTWLFRRDHRLRLPLNAMGRRSLTRIPYLIPEVVLLYKAKARRPTDETDLRMVLPHLSLPSRRWLSAAIARVHPGHPWCAMLDSISTTLNAVS
jgi:hypothetical protein